MQAPFLAKYEEGAFQIFAGQFCAKATKNWGCILIK